MADLVRAQEKMEYSRVARFQEQLEQEIDELHRRDAELQKLLNMDNNVSFLQVIVTSCYTYNNLMTLWCSSFRGPTHKPHGQYRFNPSLMFAFLWIFCIFNVSFLYFL